MTESLVLTIALLALPVIMLLAFAGCVGDDPAPSPPPLPTTPPPATPPPPVTPPATPPPAKPPTYGEVITAEPNLVSFWRLDDGVPETGDTTAKDSAPVAPKNGEYKNLPAVSRGQTGALKSDLNNKCVEFQGTSGYVEVSFDPLRNPPLSFSVEVWLKPTPSALDPQSILSSCETGVGGVIERGFALEILQAPTLRVRARVGNETPTPSEIEASLGDGSQHDGWRHVVMTFNGATGKLALYVNADDGKPDAEGLGTYKALTVSSTPLRIASNLAGALFSGRLDEVALYRVALDGPAVRKHFLAGVTPVA